MWGGRERKGEMEGGREKEGGRERETGGTRMFYLGESTLHSKNLEIIVAETSSACVKGLEWRTMSLNT